jgi:hypothetical protein
MQSTCGHAKAWTFHNQIFYYPIKQAPGRESVGERPPNGLTRAQARLWKTPARDQTANFRTNRRYR